jgi:transcriptional regulator with XRE-family HTH domain
MTAGQFIREAREARGLSQGQLGDLLGVSNRLVSHYETGRVMLTAERLDALALALDLNDAQVRELVSLSAAVGRASSEQAA